MLDSTAQICWGLPKPRNAVDGTVCDSTLRATIRVGGTAIRPAGRVAALGDRPIGDVGVGADQVVRLDVAEHERPVAAEPGPDVDLRGAAADGLERLLEGQDEPDGPAGRERHEREQRLVLGVLLATERAARVGREHADLGERQADQVGDDALQPVRMLDRAPDRDAVAVGRGHERVRLDRELGDHRERVGALDDDVRLAHRGVDVAPAVAVLAEDVGRRVRVVRPEGRVLDERRAVRQRRGEGVDGRQLLAGDPDERGRLLGRVRSLGGDRRDRLAVVLRLADGEDRAVAPLRPEARHRLRQVRGGHDEPDAGHGQGRARVDRPDPGARRIERDELDVEHVVEVEVGDVRLLAGHALDAADPAPATCRHAPSLRCDARRSASMRDPRSPDRWRARARIAAAAGLADRGRREHRLDDLLVPRAAAQVAGEPFLDLGARRVRGVREQRLRRDRAGPGCRTRTARRPCRGTPAGADGAGRRRRGPRRSSRSRRPPRPRGPGTSRR